MQTILTNAVQLVDNQFVPCEISIIGEEIQEIGKKVERQENARTIDCEGNLVTPGFVDVHVHLREPGGEKKETIETGTKAAARGGYTTICAMPNTRPVPDSVSIVEDLNKKFQETASVRVIPYGSITKRLLGKELTDAKALKQAGVFALTDDGVGVQSADQMLQAMKQAKEAGLPIVAHCEENTLIHNGVIHEGEASQRLGVPGIPSICESVQIARDVLLAEATGCHYHVCHVSTKESVRVIRDAKRAGIQVTAEVSPHHLLLNEDAVQSDDGNVKMNPPLRSKRDQEALIDGLLDGTLDFIATDHAPHTEEEKQQGLLLAPFGIVGLETAFPLLYTHLVKKNILTLKELIDFLTIKPASVFGMPYGSLCKGSKANITVIDLNKRETIDKSTFLSKGTNTPFHDWEVDGIPVLTLFEGKIVYEEATNEKAKSRA